MKVKKNELENKLVEEKGQVNEFAWDDIKANLQASKMRKLRNISSDLIRFGPEC